MHTKDYLAHALHDAGLEHMADQAARGFYHDFMSPIAFPQMQLMHDLNRAGTPAALALAERVAQGDFDASEEEADAWAKEPQNARGIRFLRGL